jgi:hypothetical protein
MDHHERTAVLRLHGEWGLYAIEHAYRARRVEHLRAIFPRPVGGDPPGARVVGQGKLGELIADLELTQTGLVRDLVAETHPVIEDAHTEDEHSARRRRLLHCHRELVVAVVYPCHFTPRLRPPLIL